MTAPKKTNKKLRARKARARRIMLTLSLVLVTMLITVGGTLAWLTDSTEPVTNTFMPSNIDLDLEEDYPTGGNANMIPGGVIAKNPHAILTNDVDAYLFVTIDESTDPDFDKYIKYEIAEGWTLLEGTDKDNDSDGDKDSYVYYRVVPKGANQSFDILKDNKVYVLKDVTKQMMDAISGENAAQPTLTFKAYTIQKESGSGNTFTEKEAWEKVNTTPEPDPEP